MLKIIPKPKLKQVLASAALTVAGPPIPPIQRIILYSDTEWEEFVREWATSALKHKKVFHTGGARDKGIDVAGFDDDKQLLGVWHNYQCKHYDHSLTPTDAWADIGKILWHSFKKEYVPPRSYYFVAPRGVGTTLTQLLLNKDRLRAKLIENWDKHVRAQVTSTQAVELSGTFAEYVAAFDLSIFQPYSPLQLVAEHATTTYHLGRFGGGLPARPSPGIPPAALDPSEIVYVSKLLDAYGDHVKSSVTDMASLKTWPKLDNHFGRQREAFYHAESLRVFVREKVEPGTFESLQEEIFRGVIDAHDADHSDAYARVLAVTEKARGVPLDAHALGGHTWIKDREGICHQLANEDRLRWKK